MYQGLEPPNKQVIDLAKLLLGFYYSVKQLFKSLNKLTCMSLKKMHVIVDKLLAVCYDVCDLKGEKIMLEFISSRINDFNIGFLLTS